MTKLPVPVQELPEWRVLNLQVNHLPPILSQLVLAILHLYISSVIHVKQIFSNFRVLFPII